MKRIFRYVIFAVFFTLVLSGCGGLRYSRVDPDAGNFHPNRMGILPVDIGAYEEARASIDQVIADAVIEKGWFSEVATGDSIGRQLQSNEELRRIVNDYTAKLKNVNFSDSDLSARIGEICRMDAFLIVSVDYWTYTVQNSDKVAQVGLGVKMINASTGKIVWKAAHSRAEKYWLVKPELSGVARALAREMIAEMPH